MQAIHQADMLTQTRHEVEEWKGRYTTIAEEFRQCKEWSTQFSQITSALEELAEIRRKSDSVSAGFSGHGPLDVALSWFILFVDCLWK